MGDWRKLAAGRVRLDAEKALLVDAGQCAPHDIVKTEDIVNRGGARLVIELVKVERSGQPLKERLRVLKDVGHVL
jgi:D-lyxose ketol-isomerase